MNRRIPWWAIIISVLLITDLVWRCVDLKLHGQSLAIAKRFEFREFTQPDEGTITMILEHGKPVYSEIDFKGNGRAVQLYWQGKEICHLESEDGTVESGRVLEYWDRDGKPTAMLIDREGRGDFIIRTTYPQGKQHNEVWLDGRWEPMEDRNNKRGVILNNQWFPLEYTNAAWNVVK
jgi:hypothetical protein